MTATLARPAPLNRRDVRREFVAGVLLIAITIVVFGQVVQFEFVNFDDPIYVVDHPVVPDGLSVDGVAWALTTPYEATWQPITWLSLMLDAEIFGVDPGAFHRTNLILHCLNVVLLFVSLRAMTGAVWRSALAASLFAVHPLHVESVAWITERKDVLSLFWGLVSLLAWIRYCRGGRRRDYLVAAASLTLGLMAKPMLVTWPLVFLLLDAWPLGRWPARSFASLVVEKIPLLLLSAASSVATFLVQSRHGAVTATHVVSVGDRLANALVSYARYLGKMIWPRDLSPLYPHPNMAGGTPWATWQIVGAGLVLVAISLLVLRFRHRPYVPVGWLWYLVTLVPMIGIVQVGSHAMADRFTYLPSIGVFVAVTWLAAELGRGSARAVRAAAVVAVAACMVLSWRQTAAWRDSITLGEHALQAGPASPRMLHNLGLALAQADRYEEALPRLQEAVRLKPDHARAWNNLGRTWQAVGKIDDAIASFERAASLQENAQFSVNLSSALARAGRDDEAIEAALRAVHLDPDDAVAHNNLGILLARADRLDEAIVYFGRAVEIAREYPDAAENLRQARELLDAPSRARESVEAPGGS